MREWLTVVGVWGKSTTCTEAIVCPSPALTATSPQSWRQEALSIQRSSTGGAPGLMIPLPTAGFTAASAMPTLRCTAPGALAGTLK